MSPMQQMLLGVGAKKSSVFVDDIFSTFLYKGTGSPQTITNGIDLSNKGGMVWIKSRDWTRSNNIYDTARGVNKVIYTEGTNAEVTKGPSNADSGIYQFNNNGFNIGAINGVGANNYNYSSWTFRKAPGFFTCLKFTGTGSVRTVDHDLNCVPGMIIIKRLDTADNWIVYHRNQHGSNPPGYYLQLNESTSIGGATNRWNDTAPTATQFTVGTAPVVNAAGDEFIAYLFAGGESNASEARSVDFDGSGDYLEIANSSDLEPGSGDLTIEYWFKMAKDADLTQYHYIFSKGFGQQLAVYQSKLKCFFNDLDSYDGSYNVQFESGSDIQRDLWYHAVVTRSGNVWSLYLNGTLEASTTASFTVATTSFKTLLGAGNFSGSTVNYEFKGLISNFRYVKGTAVYTSSFRPPYKPLTNITNTKFLCCNNSSTTGSTVTPGTITANGDPTASTDSPFDDPAGFVFGDAGESVIKCGSYVGNGSVAGPDVFLGFEPSFLLIKRTDTDEIWNIYDSMRGITAQENDARLIPNSNAAEYSGADRVDLTPTGFTPRNNNTETNADGGNYVYLCIRRPDGYCGKPRTATELFAASYGTNNAPWFKNSNFPVDLSIHKRYDQSEDWYQASRLQGTYGLRPSLTSAEANITSYWKWDYMEGWNSYTNGTSAGNYISYQFKRGAGFDCICYKGSGVSGLSIPHSMNVAPEMMLIKRRDASQGWLVYHTGLNGGSGNTYEYGINLSDSVEWQEGSSGEAWGGADPTSTHFTVGELSTNNTNNGEYLALLFSSITNISKVGVYTGSNSAQSINCGFSPRFLLIKNTANTDDWIVLDTTRGWGSGDDKRLKLNDSGAQSDHAIGEPTSTGFDLAGNVRNFNQAGRYYIYYAHA